MLSHVVHQRTKQIKKWWKVRT